MPVAGFLLYLTMFAHIEHVTQSAMPLICIQQVPGLTTTMPFHEFPNAMSVNGIQLNAEPT
jgi:hypothetical protein